MLQNQSGWLVIDVRTKQWWRLSYEVPKLPPERNLAQQRNRLYPAWKSLHDLGRGTVSAAMFNAIELRKELKAILVGEPTGSRPNGYSENDELTLPNSRLQLSFSTRYYKLQDQDAPAVMPDKLIEPSWETYPLGRDSGDGLDTGRSSLSK